MRSKPFRCFEHTAECARVISSAPVLSKGPFVIQPSEDLVKKIVATQGALYQKLPIPQPATGLQGSRATKTDRDSSPSVLRAGLGRVQQLLGTVFQNDAKPRRLRSESLVKGLHRGQYVYSHAKSTNPVNDYPVHPKLTN